MKLSMNVKFHMTSEQHCGLIVHAGPEECNLISWVQLDTMVTTTGIACDRIDGLRCHQYFSIPRYYGRGIPRGIVI